MGLGKYLDSLTTKLFRQNLDLNGTASILQGTSDPTLVAPQSAPQGSLYLMTGASGGKIFKKMDSGSSTNWQELITSLAGGEPRQNFLLNSNFDLWQRGTSTTVANGATAYQADRWYAKNSLGTNGVLTYSRVSGASDGAKYGASVKITTAPTASQTNGCELYQTLENFDSLPLYNQTASFQVKVKALGNVNQVGVQFFYKTTEAKVDTAIGSEVTASVTTGAFTTLTITSQALGTSQTTSGVIGVRIRITGVSTGNTYDLNNGFIVEQAIVNKGAPASEYLRCYRTAAEEVEACQRFFEKSYDMDVAPGTATSSGMVLFNTGNITSAQKAVHVPYKATKRTSPTGNYFDSAGNSSRVSGVAADGSTTSDNITPGGFTRQNTQGFCLFMNATTAGGLSFHWQADAEI